MTVSQKGQTVAPNLHEGILLIDKKVFYPVKITLVQVTKRPVSKKVFWVLEQEVVNCLVAQFNPGIIAVAQ